MIRGLERFRTHFATHEGKYVLIGGTACMIAFNEADLVFRATRDLDLVLVAEMVDRSFVDDFWRFVKDGGYDIARNKDGRPCIYRFTRPRHPDFPMQLELFCRKPDGPFHLKGRRIAPIALEEHAVSPSAILMDDEYYHFIVQGGHVVQGLTVLSEECLIPLKAVAWLDMVHRLKEGAPVDRDDIRKHRRDVIRLSSLLDPSLQVPLSETIRKDMNRFIETLEAEVSGLENPEDRRTTLEAMRLLRSVYLA